LDASQSQRRQTAGDFPRPIMTRLLRWRPGGYLHASAGLLGWLLLRAASQAVMVLILARLLGAAGYGQFVTVLAVASFFTPLAGLGLQGVLLRDGARTPRLLPEQIGAALDLWWRSTAVFGLAGVAVALWVLPANASVPAVAGFVVAEVASSSLVELIARVEQSQHLANRFGAILTGLTLARLTGLAGYAFFFKANVSGWMGVYAAASLGYATALYIWLFATRRPLRPRRTRWVLVREGMPFAVGALSMRLQAEFNKPVLAQLGYAQAGNYSAAQRVVDLASLPLLAMQEALWSRLYASADPRRRMVKTGGALVTLALLGGVILTLSAPLLPTVLGPGFEHTAVVLVWLAWLPTVQAVRNLANVYLVATHRAHVLTGTYVTGGIASMLLTTVLVAVHGMAGAVAAAYLTEVAILTAQFAFQTILRGKQNG